jgi:hypothetical protein
MWEMMGLGDSVGVDNLKRNATTQLSEGII